MKSEDLLSKKISVDKDEAISNTLKKMEKNSIRDIPVTNDGQYMGSLSYKDLAYELGSLKKEGKPSSQLHVSTAYKKDSGILRTGMDLKSCANELVSRNSTILLVQNNKKNIIGSIKLIDILKNIEVDRELYSAVKTNFEVVSPSDRVVNSRRKILDRGAKVLVIKENDSWLGIVTDKEIAHGLHSFRKLVPDEKQDSRIRNLLVEDIMENNFLEIKKSNSLSTAIEQLVSEKNYFSLVYKENEIIGFVSQLSILKALFGDERE